MDVRISGLSIVDVGGDYPRDLRTHILRLLGPKTVLSILYKAFGLF